MVTDSNRFLNLPNYDFKWPSPKTARNTCGRKKDHAAGSVCSSRVIVLAKASYRRTALPWHDDFPLQLTHWSSQPSGLPANAIRLALSKSTPNSTTQPCINLATACDSSVLDTMFLQCQMNFVNGFLLCRRDLHQMTLIDEHLLVSRSLNTGIKGCHRSNLGLQGEAETSSDHVCKMSTRMQNVYCICHALHLPTT